MKSYTEWYHRKNQTPQLSLFQIIRIFCPHAAWKITQSLFRAEYLSKFEKQLPTWLANIVNVLIVLGAVLSILACPIWVHPFLTVASLSKFFRQKRVKISQFSHQRTQKDRIIYSISKSLFPTDLRCWQQNTFTTRWTFEWVFCINFSTFLMCKIDINYKLWPMGHNI